MYIKHSYYRLSDRFVCICKVAKFLNLAFKIEKIKTKDKNSARV
jgi:hypothetical protein